MTTNAAVLAISTPSAEGIRCEGIEAFLDALENAPDVDPHSVMMLRHGRVVAAGWWAPYSADRLHLLYSLSKSFTSTAAGFAVAEGLIDLDKRVIDYFPQLSDEITHLGSRSILVRHVASMATGHAYDTWNDVVADDPDDPVRGFLRLPPDKPPGTVFAYNQSATFTLAAIIQRRTGQTLTDYLRPRLFDPLGIGTTAWQQHDSGLEYGFTGMHATTDAIARLGQFYLQRGWWRGNQLLPAGWVADATRSHIDNSGEPNPDWQQGYGFQFWMSRHGYRGDGAHGQFCLVLPEQDLVIAITAATENMQYVLDSVWERVLPMVRDAPEPDEDADAALQRRLGRLSLPVAHLPAQPPAAWSTSSFVPTNAGSVQQRSLIGVGVHERDGGWVVTLQEPDSQLSMPLGTGDWAVSEPTGSAGAVPIAVNGGWTGADTLRFDVLFLETPHRLNVSCNRACGTFESEWRTAPLHPGTLSEQRAPLP